ncbi:dTDP-4-dehydrorhamnose reductase [Hyphomicrobium nitrativorans NL23]|uniref:dTDP-4-dehydrorhamnose reductase n=1 Tax=Hyphomicrobium nitrativorans NL23 TaxID=1029756 RepID=V5SID3_9HYPH|nr:dTDP-4-dehydrorhamnose reductase [Hyphomicrobium nitrativorans]AHB49709.1 dTDP-4-dehydrorhamnose reductase [Hyphomicrobium nitrativorans NL23]
MRLLIAGWHGQVARALIEAAPSLPHIKALAAGRAALDVRDPRSIERAFSDISPNVVINTAAYTAVDRAETDEEAAFALNRDGARLLACAAARRDIPVLHVSTHYVFDGTKKEPYVETDAPSPQTVFGRSKVEGERAVAEVNPRHVIVRTGWVFGPSGRNFATNILASANASEPLRVVADQHGNPTYAPHLAALLLDIAHRLAVERADDVWGTYHAAGSGVTSWHGLATEILARACVTNDTEPTVVPIASSDYPTAAPRPKNSTLDCARLYERFGLRLPPWQDGVAACIARHLES